MMIRIADIIKTVVVAVMLTAVMTVTGEAAVASRGELALPAVPDSLRAPAERADYILLHFWDAMEWGDSATVRDGAWMEQTFVNFASLIPYASSAAALDSAFTTLFDRAQTDMEAYRLLLGLADRYLYEPESPMHDEEAYMRVLDAVIADNCLDPVLFARYTYQLDEAKRNRQGSAATDFPLTLMSGEGSTLYDVASGADETLVMFYDAECDHCIEVIEMLSASPELKSRVDSGQLKVLAVYFEGDETMLPEVRRLIPGWWVSAYTPGNPVEEQELYSIRRLPTLYLISRDGIVKKKDFNPETLL
ncbi:MAG: hypothetical protein DBY35_04350 [Bacteroidales bacterium]|nr:MAG: hypothetical protein DBY35_04350 [Bacteroidales bacterium]